MTHISIEAFPMPVDATGAPAKTAAITDAFATIGHADDIKMPRSKGNAEPVAWEYHVAKLLDGWKGSLSRTAAEVTISTRSR